MPFILTGTSPYKNVNFFEKKCCTLLDTSVSGSPIIQNGKLVGAITHVFLRDSSLGYGIFIEEMLKSN